MTHQMFTIQGMTCESCVQKITDSLKADTHIKNLHVTLNPPQIHFDADEKYSSETINQKLKHLNKYSVSEMTHSMSTKSSEPSSILRYMPLILLFALSAGVPALNIALGRSDLEHWMHQFMGITLIVLAYFKLIDLPKFAEAFSTYDPIAMKFYNYGYIYPFFELIAGIGFTMSLKVEALSIFVILFLLSTTIGVVKALRENRKFQCACLGTVFNLPLTKVTVAENSLMIAMSLMIIF